jgi:hypothetical protein
LHMHICSTRPTNKETTQTTQTRKKRTSINALWCDKTDGVPQHDTQHAKASTYQVQDTVGA